MNEFEKHILLIINSILNTKIFYSKKDSIIQNALNDFDDLYNNFSINKYNQFIQNELENNLLLSKKIMTTIIKYKKFNNKFKPSVLLNEIIDENILNANEILTSYKKIIPLDNVLPFNYISSLVIDKKFLQHIDITNHYEVRQEIKPIIQFLQSIKNNNILLPNLNIEFDYNNHNSTSGYWNGKKIYISTDKLNSSALHHEYFHALETEITSKLNVNALDISIFPNRHDFTSIKAFNHFIDTFDDNLSSKDESKTNLKLYLDSNFPKLNKIPLNDITKNIIFKYIDDNISIFTDRDGNNKYEKRDELIDELLSHINYALDKDTTIPKRTLYAIFSEFKDLSTDFPYFSKNNEKLARIYQAKFDNNDNIKQFRHFPLGSENHLIDKLHTVVLTELSLFLIKQNNILNIRNKYLLNNIPINNNSFK